jgi:hypothetical protein
MTYTITALSIRGDVEEQHDAAEAALDAAMRLEAQGCRLIRIKSHDGKECSVTHLYRSIHGTGIDDLG